MKSTAKVRNEAGKFGKGNKAAQGNHKTRTGRPSTDIRELAGKLCDEYGILERMVLMACNEAKEDNPYPPDVQFKAMVYLLDRAHGKPSQAHEISGKDGEPLVFKMVKFGVDE